MNNQWRKLSITRVPVRYFSARYHALVRQESGPLALLEREAEKQTRITASLEPTKILPTMRFDTEPALHSVTIPRLRQRMNTTYIAVACAVLLLGIMVGLVIVISHLPGMH